MRYNVSCIDTFMYFNRHVLYISFSDYNRHRYRLCPINSRYWKLYLDMFIRIKIFVYLYYIDWINTILYFFCVFISYVSRYERKIRVETLIIVLTDFCDWFNCCGTEKHILSILTVQQGLEDDWFLCFIHKLFSIFLWLNPPPSSSSSFSF